MKQTLSFALIMLFAVSSVFAKGPEERASKHTTVKDANMSITYGQPSKKGRQIFGALVPYDQVWRTGADEATEITFNKDCTINDHLVKAGTYTLFTIPRSSEWTLILNTELKQWGAFGYDKIKSKNVLEVTIAANHANKVVETFTMTPKPEGVLLEWDNTIVLIPIKFK
jgi:Protein of unknown function (DUF2911)